MIKLSFIIPIYNSENYLERCVKSCMSQGLEEDEYEILLCNDGSTDGSLALAEDFSKKHDCIKVYSQENAGAGMARNLGLKNALGCYVMFVDADDYLNTNSIKRPLENCFNKQLDVNRYLLENIIETDGRKWMNKNPVACNIIYQGKELLSNRNVPLDTVCSAFYRLALLRDNNIYFSKLTSSEDVDFTLRVYLYAKRVMYDEARVYVYEIKDNTRGHPVENKRIIDFIKNDLLIAATIRKAEAINSNSRTLCNCLKMRSNSTTISSLLALWRLKQKLNKSEAKEIIDYAKTLDIYPISGRSFSWKASIVALLFLNRESLFISQFKKSNKDN